MRVFILSLVLLVITSCQGFNKSSLESQVRSDINEQFSKEASSQGISYKITSFDLVHVSGNEYQGALKTVEDGVEYVYSVYVTYDGSTYYWELY